ncbi:TRAFAC clade GTPase domain-containing protein [Streptomyces sp. NBC_00354]|uniref:TRAFAC clade GTPase domain-containing protein n=1 Tax=Streptomyces sp. NBC_00354 TaxID=2975723 RepID=UPI002E25F7FF
MAVNAGLVLQILGVATGVIGAAVCLGYGLWRFLGLALGAAWTALGPRTPGTPDPRVGSYGGTEPGQPAYWARQMWIDAVAAARAAAHTVRYLLVHHWLDEIVRHRLLSGRNGSTGDRAEHVLGRLLLRLLAPATALAALLSALLSCVLLLGIALAFAAQLLLVSGVALAGVLAGRSAERLWKLARGIRMKCPYPGCYRPFPLAVHICPGCGAAHRELRPGRYGALRHVCRCGRALPTTALAGRRKLTARCPHCDQGLPPAVGTTRVVHVPLIGGTSAGKTMLMAAMLDGLRAWSHESALTVEFASPADRREANTLGRQVESTGWALKTQGGQPRALMLLVGRGHGRLRLLRRQRLLYLYDPMGESLRDADTTRRQEYLAHADGVLLVADVLASPAVRRTLRGGDGQLAVAARPADLGPVETYAGFTGELQGLGGRRRRLGVAAVVTKRDVLDRLDSLPRPEGGAVDAWLAEIGLGELVRALGHDFAAARYWAVSAHAATGAGALASEQRRAAEPVLWLLSRTGLRIGGAAAAAEEPRLPRLPRPRGRTGRTAADRSSL